MSWIVNNDSDHCLQLGAGRLVGQRPVFRLVCCVLDLCCCSPVELLHTTCIHTFSVRDICCCRIVRIDSVLGIVDCLPRSFIRFACVHLVEVFYGRTWHCYKESRVKSIVYFIILFFFRSIEIHMLWSVLIVRVYWMSVVRRHVVVRLNASVLLSWCVV